MSTSNDSTDTDIHDRLDRLESLVEQQQETIQAQRDRIRELEGDPTEEDGTDPTRPVSRRDAIKAGGLVGLLGLGAGTASADSQGQIGTSSDPLTALYTVELNGGGSAIHVGDALNLSDSDSIQNAGTDAIQFDSNQNVKLPNGNLSMSASNAIELNTDEFGGDYSRPSNGHLLFGMGTSDGALLFGQGGSNDGEFVIRTQDDGDEEIKLQQHNSAAGDPPITQFQVDPGGNARINNDLRTQGGTTIWDASNGYIPQNRLQNDSLLVTAGNGLKNGGQVSLGSSTTLDVNPSDFAGSNLSADGSDNLNIDWPANVVIVANSGGDYTSLSTALANVTGPATVWVAPGEYQVDNNTPLDIPSDVSLVGAGRSSTRLYVTGNLRMFDQTNSNVSIRSLTLEWRSGTGGSEVIRNKTSDFLIEDVKIEDTGGDVQYGILSDSGLVRVLNSNIRMTTNSSSHGFLAAGGDVTARNCVLEGNDTAVYANSGSTINVANNKLINGIGSTGTVNKFGNYDGSYSAV